MDPAALKAAWDAKYAREPAPWRGPPELGALAPLLAALPPGARVLEVGGGGGKTLAALRGAPGGVALDWARAPLAALPGARVQGDARALPFRSGGFDAVTLVHVLTHLPAPLRTVAAGEAARVLAPGGLLLFADFATGDLREGKGEPTGEERSRLRDQGIHYHYFEAAEVRALFAGLREVAWEEERKEERFRGVRHERRLLRAAYRRL